MALKDLTDRNAVILAMQEFDQIGADRFYRMYGFGKALKFFVLHDGKQYDSKAISAVAHRYQFGKPLKNSFSGGVATVVPVLRRLGFEIVGKRIDDSTVRIAEEVPDELWEGGRKQISVNAYERNVQARAQCIEAHGSKCAICSFDFGATYGEDFSGFIHVHHRVPLARIGKRYKIDPINDLIPVCPNCHAVLHHGGTNRNIDDVRKLVTRAL
jgi:5-methylcytosine-specific restriction enzyme A